MRNLLLAGLFSTSFVLIASAGEIYPIELALLGGLTVAALGGRVRNTPYDLRVWLLALVLWLVSQFITDVIRQSASIDLLKGLLRVLFLMTNLLAAAQLSRGRVSRLLAIVSGVGLAGLFGYFIAPNAYAIGEPWKFGLAYPLTILAFCLLASQGPRFLRVLGLIAIPLLALEDVIQGARSLAGITAVAAIICLQHRWGAPTRRRSVVVLISVVAATLTLSGIYGQLAGNGTLGAKQQSKYVAQDTGRFGPLLGGRPEFAYSYESLRQNPIVGAGAYARLPPSLDLRARTLLGGLGYSRAPTDASDSDQIPTHSALLGSWVEGGIGAMVFWLMVLALCLKTLAFGPASASLGPLQIYLATLLTWDTLFSPFGADRRLTVALTLLVLLTGEHAKYPDTRLNRMVPSARNPLKAGAL